LSKSEVFDDIVEILIKEALKQLEEESRDKKTR